MIYFFSLGLTCLLGVAVDKRRIITKTGKNLNNGLWILSVLPFAFISAVRYDVGKDYLWVYWKSFEAISQGMRGVAKTNAKLEIGFFYFDKLLSIITDDPRWFFVCSSVIIYFVIFAFLRRENRTVMLPYALFFLSGLFFSSMNIVRQFMALAIVLLFWRKKDGKVSVWYVLGCALAMTFHFSAGILLSLFVLSKIKITKKRFVSLMLLGTALIPLAKRLLFFIVENTRYRYYLDGKSTIFVVDVDKAGVVFASVITVLTFIIWKKDNIEESKHIWIWTLLIYDLFVISSFFVPLANRLSVYFKFFVFCNLIPTLFNCINRKHWRIAFLVGVFVLGGLSLIYLNYWRGISNVFPYKTIWG